MPRKSDLVHSDTDVLSGTPVGTRVPVQSLFDYQPLVGEMKEALARVRPGSVHHVGG